MVVMKLACFVVLMSIFNIYFLACVNCQLPNIYDLTWFESFSLQNYDGFLNDYNTDMGSNSETHKMFPSSNPHVFLDEDPVSIGKNTNKYVKNSEENIVSADGPTEDSGHFDGRSIQHSDRYI